MLPFFSNDKVEPHMESLSTGLCFHFSARVIIDRETGRSRGFGFVNYDSEESASSALSSMDGQVFPSCLFFVLISFFSHGAHGFCYILFDCMNLKSEQFGSLMINRSDRVEQPC